MVLAGTEKDEHHAARGGGEEARGEPQGMTGEAE
jgi:hypothetical protein